eukprot:Gregarina_sp_Poly_1__11255@NODE_92_length_14764_cov_231_259032_g79_i0_p6_GENE_NODE_92_length_14764_cov_231_259032_g79_i0NODE_92_length_14764_cov_231_259032_g79_i0_p6_ORF_typecomplete_len237_score32_70Pyridox_oxase_2/PF12766_7/2_9e13Putative_PNPOx/PF01243_20/0_00019Pyrid_ox_like/PF16242_5/0_091Pyrid_ox_like/PF16242_5/8_8e02_NODE_92_length_14764_cov_231_259032_g79_i088339543
MNGQLDVCQLLENAWVRGRDRSPENGWMQFATATADGSPRVRSMVLRELSREKGGLMRFTTTAAFDSDKIRELITNEGRYECCWFIKDLWVQFRLRGKGVRIIAAPDQAEERISRSDSTRRMSVWRRMGHRGRAQFLNQALLRDEDPEFELAPPSEFCVLEFVPTFIQYLDLSSRASNGAGSMFFLEHEAHKDFVSRGPKSVPVTPDYDAIERLLDLASDCEDEFQCAWHWTQVVP